MEDIAPMLVAITLILTIGGVVLLKPLARRLGDLLELMVKERSGEIEAPKTDRMETLLESLNARLGLVEERLDFTDQLLTTRRGERKELPRGEAQERE